MPPGSLNPDPYFRPKNVIFHTCFQTRPLKSIPFSDLAFKQKLCYYYLDQSANETILQIHFEFSYFSFFRTHLELKLPQKPYQIPDQNGQSVYPFSHQNGAKTLPDGAAHAYITYIREYPPPPGSNVSHAGTSDLIDL